MVGEKQCQPSFLHSPQSLESVRPSLSPDTVTYYNCVTLGNHLTSLSLSCPICKMGLIKLSLGL